jgi:CheY-like chemotaxis protein
MRAYEQVVRDLEQSRRELHDANQAKDRFLATLSHELRTPLTAMLGWVRLLRGGTLDAPSSTRALEVIERNTKLLAQLIEDLLDVSRIITGKLRLEFRPVDAVAVVEAALESIQALADVKSIRLLATLERATGSVSGDPDRLQQVVWNLLSNAIKFTPSGGSVVVRLEPAGECVRITVTDTGKGIEADLLPHIFDHFRQGDSGSERTHGLGLGLAIVRHFVELHRGTVSAHSAGPGRGATFTVDLPIGTSDAGRIDVDGRPWRFETPLLPKPVRLSGLRVLVVDDEPDARDLLTAVLEDRGADVTAVASASAALETLARWTPDVLVSDIGLPGDDGYVLMRKIRALEDKHGGRVPAVAVTAYARVEDGARALAAGFQVHLAKPIDPAAFCATVAEVAGARQKRDDAAA